MLNYRNTSLIFLGLSVICFGAVLMHFTLFFILWCFLFVVYILLLVMGASLIQMNFFLKAVNRGDPTVAKVALTFDDGPDEQTTEALLDILKSKNIPATFFCIGSKMEKNEQLVKKIYDHGHRLGNHTWSHSFFFDFFLPGNMVDEINRTETMIERISGHKSMIFRPPYGVTNPFLSRALKKTGHVVIGWSLRTFDTSGKEHKVLRRINKNLRNGDIILLHDQRHGTVKLLEKIIDIINQRGMKIVSLDELIPALPDEKHH